MRVEHATEKDIPEWLDLANEVGEMFGADMANDVDFLGWLQRSIARGSAYCVRLDGELAGAMAFREGWINWLAVPGRCRHQGVGRALVRFAQSTGALEIRVTTFGRSHPHPQSASARDFFLAMGFQSTNEQPGLVPDGTPREILLWSQHE